MAGPGLHGVDRPLVSVPERDHCEVSGADWSKLSSSSDFWMLVERGIISVSQRERARVRLSGGKYVGKARFPEIDLEVGEKIPGALNSLLSHSTDSATRVLKGEAAVASGGHFIDLLVHEFLNAASTYVTAGLDFKYQSKLESGSLIGGAIDIRNSIRLRMQGRGHLAAFHRSEISQDTRINRCVLASLREVERIAKVVDLQPGDLDRARFLSMPLSAARTPMVVFGERSQLARDARELASSVGTDHRDLLLLASTILSGQSFAQTWSSTDSTPRAWFVDLEGLFELAVRRALQKVGGGTYSISDAKPHERRVFAGLPTKFRANPDVVLASDTGFPAIGDAKYKQWPGIEDSLSAHSDIYQLLVHTAAYESHVAFLVYPHDSNEFRELLDSATSCDVLIAGLDISDLESGAAELLKRVEGLIGDRHDREKQIAIAESRGAEELEASGFQNAAVRTMMQSVTRVKDSELKALEDLLTRLIPEAWGQLNAEEQKMLVTAVYFGHHAEEHALDYSGPLLGLFSVCEKLLRVNVFARLPSSQRRRFKKVTFGAAVTFIADSAKPKYKAATVIARWLESQSDIEPGALIACAVRLRELNTLRIAAAHSEIVTAAQWTEGFDAIVDPSSGGILNELTACFTPSTDSQTADQA